MICSTCNQPVIGDCDKSICAGAKFARLERLEAVLAAARVICDEGPCLYGDLRKAIHAVDSQEPK